MIVDGELIPRKKILLMKYLKSYRCRSENNYVDRVVTDLENRKNREKSGKKFWNFEICLQFP